MRLDPENCNRRQATTTVANTTDPNVLNAFTQHRNSHVKKYAAHKLSVGAGTAVVNFLAALCALTPGEDLVGALAERYGEERSTVEALFDRCNGDQAAVKRCLASRLGARKRKTSTSQTATA